MTGDDRLSILITGGSSFTGWSFITHAAANGHLVVAPLARRPGDYQGSGARRVRSLMSNPNVTVVEAAPRDLRPCLSVCIVRTGWTWSGSITRWSATTAVRTSTWVQPYRAQQRVPTSS